MANRHTLAIHKLDEFKEWLDCTDVQYRDTTAPWQVLQVRLPDDPRWHAIYRKLHAKEHLSVPEPLVKLVQEFIERPLGMHRSPTGRTVQPHQPPFHNLPIQTQAAEQLITAISSNDTPPWE